MNKKVIMVGAVIGMTIGGAIPVLFGANPMGGLSILGSMVGGFLGIWAAAWVSKRYG